MSSLTSNSIKKSEAATGKSTLSFKQQFSHQKRSEESRRILLKYPDRIPVIAERSDKSTLPNIDKKKYLVPGDLTFSQFIYVIRKRIKLGADEALFLFVNNTIPPASALMSDVYKEHKSEDFFLYIFYHNESVFGGK
jgi:GABA(A) receptor-associated protein